MRVVVRASKREKHPACLINAPRMTARMGYVVLGLVRLWRTIVTEFAGMKRLAFRESEYEQSAGRTRPPQGHSSFICDRRFTRIPTDNTNAADSIIITESPTISSPHSVENC